MRGPSTWDSGGMFFNLKISPMMLTAVGAAVYLLACLPNAHGMLAWEDVPRSTIESSNELNRETKWKEALDSMPKAKYMEDIAYKKRKTHRQSYGKGKNRTKKTVWRSYR
jgi:hypothetical protein